MGNLVGLPIGAALNFLLRFHPLEGQTTMGCVRFIVYLFLFFVSTQQDATTHNSRLDFTCDPETNNFHRELCFSPYSAKMNPLMRPYQFLLVTACILVVLWTAMIQYSHMLLPKIRKEQSRRVKVPSERKHLCHELWNMSLCHVGCEAIVVSFMLGLFIYTQEFNFPETYNCALISAQVITCTGLDTYFSHNLPVWKVHWEIYFPQ